MSVFDRVLGLAEAVATTQSRLLLSVGLVAVAVGVGFLVAPAVTGWLARFSRRRVERTEAGSALERLDDLLDWRPVRTVSLRGLQTAVVAATGITLLVLWGYVDWARSALDLFAASVPYLVRLLLTGGLVGLAVVGTRYLEARIEDWAADSTYVTRHQESVAFRVLQITLFVAVGMTALSLWSVNLSGLVISAGFLGIVVGMASRKTLGSLVAGFVLMFSRPFEIGDWVEIDDEEGIVTDITIVNTRLRNLDGETVVLPNDRVASETVVNRSKRDRLRITTTVGVDYDTDVERAEAVVREALAEVDSVAGAPKPEVLPTGFGDSAITLEVRYWIERPNARKKWQTQAAVVRAVKTAFEEAGVTVPFPQRELSGRADGDPGAAFDRGADAEGSAEPFPDG